MIKKLHLDRGDSLENIRETKFSNNRNKMTILRGKKSQDVKNVLGIKDFKDYIENKGIYIYYHKNIVGTFVEKEMQPNEYFIVTQEKEIDEEMMENYIFSPEIGQIARILYYIYKDESGNIMYFKNPFYEGNIIKSIQKEYLETQEKGTYTPDGDTLVEIPIYNRKVVENLNLLGYKPLDINFMSEELENELANIVMLISDIDGHMVIKGVNI